MADMITEHVKLPGGVTAVLERPGARLVYEVAGDGPAVVLIHGFGLDMRMWDPQIGPLAGRFRVVRHDCRGFGASGPFDPGVPYTHAGDLVALLDHLDIGDAALAGLSFGGRVALQAALAAPDRVRGLVLLDAVLDGVPWDPGSARALDEVARRVQAGGGRAGRAAWLAHPLFATARPGAPSTYWRASPYRPSSPWETGTCPASARCQPCWPGASPVPPTTSSRTPATWSLWSSRPPSTTC